MFNIRTANLLRLNSATKYPSIPTYHTIGDKGMLQPQVIPLIGEVAVTEKIDGTNSRIIFTPDGQYIIGSREELLYARGDLIGNPALGVVEALKPLAEHLAVHRDSKSGTGIFQDHLIVYFFETFGGNINGGKNYSGTGKVAFRLFDIADVPLSILDDEPERISSWREHGGQTFRHTDQLEVASAHSGLAFQSVPYLNWIDGSTIPTDIRQTHDWLTAQVSTTNVALDDGAKCVPEGVVVRTRDRKTIVKIRYEDYQRTIRRMAAK